MLLNPHHLQQWDRYQQHVLHERVRVLNRYDWGITSLTIDSGALVNGEVQLRQCSGIMPDGLVFDIPGIDLTPNPENVKNLPPGKRHLSVYLAIQQAHADGYNILDGTLPAHSQAKTRFSTKTIRVPDEVWDEGRDEEEQRRKRNIQVAQPNFRLLMGPDDLAGNTHIRIANIAYKVDGTYELDKEFIPTCLRVASSPRLQDIVGDLLDRLDVLSQKLVERRVTGEGGEASLDDVRALGRLGAIYAHYPLLLNYVKNPEGHPEGLFMILQSLAGQLMAYLPAMKMHPSELPVYTHDDLTRCFGKLYHQLIDILSREPQQQGRHTIRWDVEKEFQYRATLNQSHRDMALYLFIEQQEWPTGEQYAELEKKVLIGAPSEVTRGFQGILLNIQNVERPVLQRQGNYFKLEQTGEQWGKIFEEGPDKGVIAVTPLRPFVGLKMTLIALEQ